LQHTTVTPPQRKYVSGPPKIAAIGVGIHRNAYRRGAILRTDTGRDAEARACVDADGERSALLLRIELAHLWQIKMIRALSGQRKTDEAARPPNHEIHDLGRNVLGSAHEVTLILAVIIVCHDDHLSRGDILERLFHGSELSVRH
jgi:hypothetical protein